MNISSTIDSKTGNIIFTITVTKKQTASIAAYKVSDSSFAGQVMNPTILNIGIHQYIWDRRRETQEIISIGDYRFDLVSYDAGDNGDLFPIDWFLMCNSSKNTSVNRLLGGSPYADMLLFNDRLYTCRKYGEVNQLINYSLLIDLQTNRPAIVGLAHQGVSRITTNGVYIYIQCYANSGSDQEHRTSFITAIDPSNNTLHDFGTGINFNTNYGNFPAFAMTPFVLNQSQQGDIDYIQGLAAQPGSGLLFQLQKDISGNSSRVLVYNNMTYLYTTQITDANVRSCKCDGQGNLWVLYKDKIKKFTATGTSSGALTDTGVQLTGFTDAQRFSFSPDYSYVEVTDKNTHQIKKILVSNNTVSATLLLSGGYTTGPTVLTNKYKIDEYSSIVILSDGRRFLYETLNRRVILLSVDGNYVDSQQMHDSLIETCLDRNNKTRLFCNGQEWQINESDKTPTGSAKLINHWAANDALYPTPSISNVVTINGVTLALKIDYSTYKLRLVKLVDGVGVVNTDYVSDTNSVELYPDGLHSMETYTNPDDGKGIRTDINFRSITVNNDKSVTVGAFTKLGELTGTGNTPYYDGNGGTLAAWEKLDNDRIVIWNGGKKQANFFHLGIYSLSQKKFLHIGLPDTGTDWFGMFPKKLPLFDGGDGSNYPSVRARVIGKYIIVGWQMQFYYGGNYGGLSYASEYKVFDENLMYLGNFGRNGGEVEREYVDGGYQLYNIERIANSALTQYLFKADNGKIRLYTGEDGPHCANQCYELVLPDVLDRKSLTVTLPSIPAIQPDPSNINLMPTIPFGKVADFVQGQDGWTASPAPFYNNGSDYFLISTGVKGQDYPNFFVQFGSINNRVNTLEKVINKVYTDSWRLNFRLGFYRNASDTTNTNGDVGEQNIRLYDKLGKLIAKIDYRLGRPHDTSVVEITLNEVSIWKLVANTGFYRDDMNLYELGYNTVDGLYLKTGARKVVSPLFDSTAKVLEIGKLSIYSEQSGGNRTYSLAFGAGETKSMSLVDTIEPVLYNPKPEDFKTLGPGVITMEQVATAVAAMLPDNSYKAFLPGTNDSIHNTNGGFTGIGKVLPTGKLHIAKDIVTQTSPTLIVESTTNDRNSNDVILNNINGFSARNRILFQKNGVTRYILSNDFDGDGTQNFYLQDTVTNKTLIRFYSNGAVVFDPQADSDNPGVIVLTGGSRVNNFNASFGAPVPIATWGVPNGGGLKMQEVISQYAIALTRFYNILHNERFFDIRVTDDTVLLLAIANGADNSTYPVQSMQKSYKIRTSTNANNNYDTFNRIEIDEIGGIIVHAEQAGASLKILTGQGVAGDRLVRDADGKVSWQSPPSTNTFQRINPSTAYTTLNIPLPPTPIAYQVHTILFGGTITAGNFVVQEGGLTVSPNTGQNKYEFASPNSANGGDSLQYTYLADTQTWFRTK